MEASAKTADRWRERIVAQQASGQSIRGWCRGNGCPEHGFYWWRARLKLPRADGRQRRPHPVNLINFAEVLAGIPAEAIRLRLSGERELLLPASMPVEQVAKLVRAIEGLS
jgi:hypothetical protein